MQFRCRLASPNGEVTEGVYAAESEARLRHDFEEKGLFVLALKPKVGLGSLAVRLPQRTTIRTAEFLVFNQELATLLKAGMPLVQSLDLLRRRVESEMFGRVLDDVYDRVRAGAALSEAFAAQSSLFPGVYTASLLAGERSGSLDAVIRRYVEHAKVVAAVKRKMVSALIYPAILTGLAVVLVSIIVLKVVPAFTDFYASFEAQLPLGTRLIVGLSDFLRAQAVTLVLGGAIASLAFAVWLRQPGRGAQLDRAFLRVPLMGDVARKFATSQMSRTLSTLLAGGLPLVNAIDIAARSVGNRFVAAELQQVGVRVREGVAFWSALDSRRVFPDVAVKMAEVGEATGALQDMLGTVADFYDEEIGTRMERFVTMVEPILLVIMGIVIAGLLLALYLPLFQLSSVL